MRDSRNGHNSSDKGRTRDLKATGAPEIPLPEPEADLLQGVSYTTNWEDLSKAAGPSAAEGAPREHSPEPGGLRRSPAQNALIALKILVTSPAIINTTGSAIACVGSSTQAVIIHTLSTLWTWRNAVKTSLPGERSNPDPGERPALRKGMTGLFRDMLESPGFSMLMGAAAYVLAAFRDPSVGAKVAFSLFVIGQAAGAYISNLDYRGKRTSPSRIENGFKAVWNRLPPAVKNILRNPGPWYSLGNIVLVTSKLNLQGLSVDLPFNILLGTGTAILGASTLRGISQAVSGNEGSLPSGRASVLLGIGSSFLGAASLAHGSMNIGAASLLWGVSNCLYGKALNTARKTRKMAAQAVK